MLLNHARQDVHEFDRSRSSESRCPDCLDPFYARRGDLRMWHWAHHPSKTARRCGSWIESEWHLRWKQAHHGFAGWSIEWPLTLGGRKLILDAANMDVRQFREFVHALTPFYEAKHLMLQGLGLDVLWVWNGAEFASDRLRTTFDLRGVRGLLKPRPLRLFEKIGGFVHWNDQLWQRQRLDLWYPVDTAITRVLLERYREAPDAPRGVAAHGA